MTTTVKPTRRLFSDAAQYIRDHGHCRYQLQNGVGSVCIAGALNAASTGNPLDFGGEGLLTDNRAAILDDALRVVREVNDIPPAEHREEFNEPKGAYAAVVDWNNAPERTADEVITALERAAAACPESEVAS